MSSTSFKQVRSASNSTWAPSNPQTRLVTYAYLTWENPGITASWGTPLISGRWNQWVDSPYSVPWKAGQRCILYIFLNHSPTGSGNQSYLVAADLTQTLLLAPTCILPFSSLLLSEITKRKYHTGHFNSLLQGIQSAIVQVCLTLKTTPAS